MKIAKDTVVTLHYTLTGDDNETLDSSSGGEPLVYLHGGHNIIPGLEEALEGKTAGEKFKVKVPAKKAYGEHQEDMMQTIPKNQFPDDRPLEVGMRFQAQSPQGPIALTIVELTGNDVVVDGNHPLAGEDLNFDVEVTDVRAATQEELSHGHAHGPGGHHDHG